MQIVFYSGMNAGNRQCFDITVLNDNIVGTNVITFTVTMTGTDPAAIIQAPLTTISIRQV